jgi:CrcB protein
MKMAILIGLGGFTGTLLRYLVYQSIEKYFNDPFYLGTFLVNIVGSFLIGLIFGLAIRENSVINDQWRIVVATGFCGGFTTFSAFSYEMLQLIQRNHYSQFLLYTLLSLIIGVLLVFAGLKLAETF